MYTSPKPQHLIDCCGAPEDVAELLFHNNVNVIFCKRVNIVNLCLDWNSLGMLNEHARVWLSASRHRVQSGHAFPDISGDDYYIHKLLATNHRMHHFFCLTI